MSNRHCFVVQQQMIMFQSCNQQPTQNVETRWFTERMMAILRMMMRAVTPAGQTPSHRHTPLS